MPASTGEPVFSLEVALQKSRLKDGYIGPTPEQAAQAEALFSRLLAGETSPELDAGLADLGFERASASLGQDVVIVVQEAEGRREGKGIYALRMTGAPVLLQAPHRYKDLHSGTLLARLFAQGGARAAAWNTVPRWYDDAQGVRVTADLAHLETSYFNAFATAFAKADPKGARVVQVHGFDPRNRSTALGAIAGAILSSGAATPSAAVRQIGGCLTPAFAPDPVFLFPEDVTELGATTNSTAAALRALGFAGFVHIELSRDLRERLVGSPELSGRMARCLSPP